jgi:predicted metalloprotease with PDZ domain
MKPAVLVLVVAARAAAGEVAYRVKLDERAAHVAVVEMVVRDARLPLELTMPSWTPGAYELRSWGRNVTPLDAVDAHGRPLGFRRAGPSAFTVDGQGAGEVRLRYRVYAPLLSDDASQIDAAHAYLNGSSMFLAAKGAERVRHTVTVDAPSGWRIASGLEELPGGGFEALGYEMLIDAPIEAGRFAVAELRAAGRPLRIAVDGAREVPQALVRDVAAIAEAEAHLAPFPFRRYLVLIHLSDGLGKVAALEHATSTSIVVPRRSLDGGHAYDELLYVIAHELFHVWNARKLRPAELCPYDLTRAQPSRSLWIIEGVTEYYAHRALRASGRWSRERYLERLGDESLRATSAAARGLTLEEDAELTWQPPDVAAADPDAYYARGHLVALALDATVRATTSGARSLDDVVRALLAQAERAGGVLPVDGEVLARAVTAIAGADAGARVAEWSRVPDEPPRLADALAGLGLRLAREPAPARAVAGFAAEPDGDALRVVAVSPVGPAPVAGLRAGDRIVTVDGRAPPPQWMDSLAQRAPGAALAIEVTRGTRRLLFDVRLEAAATASWRVVEAPAVPRIAALREKWLAGR